MPSNCVPQFQYEGLEYNGCTTVKYHNKGWCSHTALYNGTWSPCTLKCPPNCHWDLAAACVQKDSHEWHHVIRHTRTSTPPLTTDTTTTSTPSPHHNYDKYVHPQARDLVISQDSRIHEQVHEDKFQSARCGNSGFKLPSIVLM